jgi:hypothetical protein
LTGIASITLSANEINSVINDFLFFNLLLLQLNQLDLVDHHDHYNPMYLKT